MLLSSIVIFTVWTFWIVLIMNSSTAGTLDLGNQLILMVVKFKFPTSEALVHINLYTIWNPSHHQHLRFSNPQYKIFNYLHLTSTSQAFHIIVQWYPSRIHKIIILYPCLANQH